MYETSQLNLLSRLLSNNGKSVTVYLHRVPFSPMPSLDKEASLHSQTSWWMEVRINPEFTSQISGSSHIGNWISRSLALPTSPSGFCLALGQLLLSALQSIWGGRICCHSSPRQGYPCQSSTKTPPSSYPEQGAGHVDEISGMPYKEACEDWGRGLGGKWTLVGGRSADRKKGQ